MQTIQEADDDPEDESLDSEEGSSEGEDVPLKSTNPVITIYVDDNSREVATQTDPSELGSSCKCDVVLQKLDKVLEAVELMSTEMGVTTSDVYDIKQRCTAMENQLFSMVGYNTVCTCVHVYMYLYTSLQRSRPLPPLTPRAVHSTPPLMEPRPLFRAQRTTPPMMIKIRSELMLIFLVDLKNK